MRWYILCDLLWHQGPFLGYWLPAYIPKIPTPKLKTSIRGPYLTRTPLTARILLRARNASADTDY